MKKSSACIGALCAFFVIGASVQAAPTKAAPSKATAPVKAVPFAFRDGDRVVFLGDSITQQRLYTTYIETFLLTRFPTWKLQFRNAGIDRARAIDGFNRLQGDVLDFFSPTVATINFGMNDGDRNTVLNRELYDAHLQAITSIVTRMQAVKARSILLSASAVTSFASGDAMMGYNVSLAQFAAGDAEIAAKTNSLFVDQLHPFVDALNLLRTTNSSFSYFAGDIIHPNPSGHLMMADFILTGLNAPSLVSSATIDARRGIVTQSDGAQITGIVRNADGITFNRLDKALLFPIEAAARPVLQVVPIADDLNRYIVQITDLKPGLYDIAVNGKTVTRSSSNQLANGVNLGFYDSTLSETSAKIMQHVRAKNDFYYTLTRDVPSAPPADQPAQVLSLTQKIADEEGIINDLRRPTVFQFAVKRFVAPASPAVPAALVAPVAP